MQSSTAAARASSAHFSESSAAQSLAIIRVPAGGLRGGRPKWVPGTGRDFNRQPLPVLIPSPLANPPLVGLPAAFMPRLPYSATVHRDPLSHPARNQKTRVRICP